MRRTKNSVDELRGRWSVAELAVLAKPYRDPPEISAENFSQQKGWRSLPSTHASDRQPLTDLSNSRRRQNGCYVCDSSLRTWSIWADALVFEISFALRIAVVLSLESRGL